MGAGPARLPATGGGEPVYDRDRQVIGSELIAQPFASDKYFFPRPSAVDYKADADRRLEPGDEEPRPPQKVGERAEALKATPDNPVAGRPRVRLGLRGSTRTSAPRPRYYQAARVAAARKMSVGQVRDLIDR